MKLKNLLLLPAISLIGLTAGITPAEAQETFEIEIRSVTPIRSVEVRESAFKQTLNDNIATVGTVFEDSPRTIALSQELSNQLHAIGVGENSQVAKTLCAIETLEVPSRRETFKKIAGNSPSPRGWG